MNWLDQPLAFNTSSVLFVGRCDFDVLRSKCPSSIFCGGRGCPGCGPTVDHWVVLCTYAYTTHRTCPVGNERAELARSATNTGMSYSIRRTVRAVVGTVEKSVLVPLRYVGILGTSMKLLVLGSTSRTAVKRKNPMDPWRQARLPPAGPSTQSSTPNIDEAKLPLIQRPMVAALSGGRSDKGYVISELFALIRLNLVSLQTSEPSCLLPTHLHSVTTWTWY